jgi:DNA-binding NarL/FixJ family response regulator
MNMVVWKERGGKCDMEQRKHEKGRIRLMIADDHTILRQGLAAVLAEEPDFEFFSFAEDGQQTLERYATLKPDVVLLDLRMPKRDGLGVARELVNLGKQKC